MEESNQSIRRLSRSSSGNSLRFTKKALVYVHDERAVNVMLRFCEQVPGFRICTTGYRMLYKMQGNLNIKVHFKMGNPNQTQGFVPDVIIVCSHKDIGYKHFASKFTEMFPHVSSKVPLVCLSNKHMTMFDDFRINSTIVANRRQSLSKNLVSLRGLICPEESLVSWLQSNDLHEKFQIKPKSSTVMKQIISSLSKTVIPSFVVCVIISRNVDEVSLSHLVDMWSCCKRARLVFVSLSGELTPRKKNGSKKFTDTPQDASGSIRSNQSHDDLLTTIGGRAGMRLMTGKNVHNLDEAFLSTVKLIVLPPRVVTGGPEISEATVRQFLSKFSTNSEDLPEILDLDNTTPEVHVNSQLNYIASMISVEKARLAASRLTVS